MKYGLIGAKLGHSFSKIIHEAVSDYQYDLVELDKSQLEPFLTKRDFCGINVTIPYKKDVIPYLDSISDEARSIGAVNTIVNKNGKLCGYNTDYYGMKMLIERQGIELAGKNALILGTGGTSLTARAVLNALGVKHIYQASRSSGEGLVGYDEIYRLDVDFIINTTPVGMFPNNDAKLISLDRFDNLCGVIDVIYNPLCTNLIVEAKSRGIKASGGLFMLVVQAIYAKMFFLDEELDLPAIDKAYNLLLNQKQNIVLTGMPSSGKTTLGKKLSRKLDMSFVDTDVLIEQKIGSDIASFIKANGEPRFREIEREVVKEVSSKQGFIISTGGGVILSADNMRNLKQNGLVVFINRSLDLLRPTSSRPLSSNRSDLEKRYAERLPLYKKYADITTDNNADIQTAVENILGGVQKCRSL